MMTQYKTKRSPFIKVLSFLLVICLMMGWMIPSMTLAVFAAAPTTYETITADSSASVSITRAGASQYFQFVPAFSGTYRFYSDNNSGDSSDTYGHLLDANGAELTRNDDGGNNNNFLFTYACTAGVTYYIQARMYGSGRTGSYTLHVDTVSIDCEHNYVLQSATTADCVNDGVETYICSICNSTYSNTVMTALGHNYENNVCTRCGALDYSSLTVFDVNAPHMAHPVFNSGRTGSPQRYNSSANYDAAGFTNGGYDLYATTEYNHMRNIRLGLSFTMKANATEIAQVTIYAYDVDEEDGERDCIRLVDETTGTRTVLTNTSGKDYLSGQDQRWSTTTFEIPAGLLVKDHTYHFENEETVSGWVVYIRTVDLQINGLDVEPAPNPDPNRGISYAELSGSISANGTVTANLVASAHAEEQFTLEYKATYLAEGIQKGEATGIVTVPVTRTAFTSSFDLESGAPRGTYEITVFIRYNGRLEATKSFTASYGYSAVSYHENGGSNSKPTDTNTYSAGDTVTVFFYNVPSMYGYTFLGWSTDRNATEPMYTENGVNTFTIGDSDVTLYAVWQLNVCEHEWVETSRTEPTCTTDGIIENTCAICNETEETTIPALDHDYVNGVCSRCGDIRNGKVLLIEDILPWGSRANSETLQRLADEGIIEGFEKHTSTEVANGSVDMNEYALVVLAADQNQSFYNNIPIDTLAAYAEHGGAVFLAADTSGYASGRYSRFPFGITSTQGRAHQNYIVDNTHPMITGVYSDHHILQDSDMTGSSISHNYFTNYPENTNIILRDDSGRATLIEFEYGRGLVVVSGLTFECGYKENWNFFAGYDDIFVHLYNHNENGGLHVHSFTETSRTEATCTTDGRINYECSCGQTRVEFTPALGHNIETVIETQVTCTTDGLILDRCINDGCDYEKRTVIHGEHHYSITDSREATCQVDGYIEYTCSNCGDQNYEYIEGKHHYVESQRVEPQVEVEGSITYTCTYCSDSYSIVLPALTPVLKNSSVLLIQDSLPWGENVNVTLLETLKNRGVVSSYNIIQTNALAGFDLSQYGVVFIANDQSTAMYDSLAANAEKLDNYVRAGGNLIYGACDQGWGGGGSLTHDLPGGVTTAHYYSVHNYIVNELHPIVTGVYTDNRSLRDELLKGNYCSHTYFDTASLPVGANIILRDANGNPTLVEYQLGSGTVIASGLTWEYFYVRNHYNMDTNYSKYVYDDLVTYMVYMSNTCEHSYEMVETVEATCEENGYTRYVCSICSYEYLSDIVIAPGHNHVETSRTEGTCLVMGEIVYTCSCGDVMTVQTGFGEHVEGSWIVDVAPTATQTGIRHKECAACHAAIETEILPVLAKLVIANVQAKAGSTVRVTIDVQNNPGIIGAVLTLDYDPALTLVQAEAGSAWNTLYFTTPATFSNPCNFVWDGVMGADYSNGTIITLTFQLPDDADVDTVYHIGASYTYGNMINANLEAVDMEIENGSITVFNPVGDVNGDGVVDVADVIVLRRYLAGGYGVVIDELAADINGDGYISIVDVVSLRRLLVG